MKEKLIISITLPSSRSVVVPVSSLEKEGGAQR